MGRLRWDAGRFELWVGKTGFLPGTIVTKESVRKIKDDFVGIRQL